MMYIIFAIALVYLFYTLSFALTFNKTETYLNKKQKILHNILIWVIPFFWIIILKTIIVPTPGSQHFKKRKNNAAFYESGLGFWGIWGSSEGDHSGHDGGHDGDGGAGSDGGGGD